MPALPSTARSALPILARLRPAHWLVLLLLMSFALRFLLVQQGGQLFSPDELRYALRPVKVADKLYSGDLAGAANGLLRYREHHGFITAALLPAYIHRVVYGLDPNNELSWAAYWQQPTGDFRFSALLLSLPSVFCIGMLYSLSRRAGSSPAEALLAAFLFAAANTFFMFSRHFMPIDIPMLIALAGIYCALRWRDKGLLYAVGMGMLAFLVVWVYHGYVTLAALVALVYGLFLARNLKQVVLRSVAMALGGGLIFLPLLLYNQLALGIDMLQEMRWFSETVTLGSYAEGWRFPFNVSGRCRKGLGAGLAMRPGRGLLAALARARVAWLAPGIAVAGLPVGALSADGDLVDRIAAFRLVRAYCTRAGAFCRLALRLWLASAAFAPIAVGSRWDLPRWWRRWRRRISSRRYSCSIRARSPGRSTANTAMYRSKRPSAQAQKRTAFTCRLCPRRVFIYLMPHFIIPSRRCARRRLAKSWSRFRTHLIIGCGNMKA